MARSGDSYKPSALHGYEQVMKARVLHDFGPRRMSELSRLDLQGFADRMLSDGRDPSTIRNTLMPLRAVFRRAVARVELTVNPTTGLELQDRPRPGQPWVRILAFAVVGVRSSTGAHPSAQAPRSAWLRR
jgi:site-specific recombinase XerC